MQRPDQALSSKTVSALGIVICEKHGRVGIAEACLHVATGLDGGRMPSGHRLKLMGYLFLCKGCFSSLNFPNGLALSPQG